MPNSSRPDCRMYESLIPPAEDDDDDAPAARSAISDSTLQMLHSEYARATGYQQNLLKFIYQIAGIAFPGFTAVATLLATREGDLPEVVYWLTPMGFALLYSLVLLIFFMIGFSTYYVRDLESEISARTGLRNFHYDSALAKAFFSHRSGQTSTYILYLIILFTVTTLYVALVFIGYDAFRSPIPNTSQLRHSTTYTLIYLLVNMAIALLLFWVLIKSQSIIRPLYDRYITNPTDNSGRRTLGQIARLIIYLIIPCPFDAIMKSLAMFVPFAFTMFAFHLTWTQESIMQIVAVYICLDLFAKQSTYIWNDIVDWHKDRLHPYKRLRPIAAPGFTRPATIAFLTRSIIALILSIWLSYKYDFPWLSYFVIAIYIYQYVYDHYAKSQGPWKLTSVAIGYAERAIPSCFVAVSQLPYATKEH